MANKSGLTAFTVLLFGEGLSQLGSAMTGFALGIWAYQQYGNVTDLALITAAAAIPRVLLSPISGNYVDRWDRKTVLVVGQFAAFLATLIIALLYWNDALEVWHMIVLNIVAGVFGSVVLPALQASITLIVGKEDIQRANGMAGLTIGVVQVFAPAVAGTLIATIGIDGILLIDVVSFTAGLLVLIWIKIPKPPKSDIGAEAVKGNFIAEMKFGWDFLYSRPGLFWLTIFNSFIAFGVMGLSVMITPVVLGFSDEKGLGFIATCGGLGMVFGSIAVIITGGVKRKVFAVLITSGLACIGLMITPVFAAVTPIAVGAFLVMACFPLGAAASQAIFQHKTPAEVQGRVFGFRNFLMGASTPIALLVVTPLADSVFEPLLLEGGALVDYVGHLFGTGAGRGIALMNSLIGLALLFVVILSWSYGPIRRIDIDLPDYLDENAETGSENQQNENEVLE